MPHTLYLEKHHHREFTMTDNRCVKSGGYFIPPNSPYLSQIREQYTCVNPAYNQAQALRKSGKWVNIPDEQIYACQTIPLWHTWGGGLMIPRGIDLSQYDFQKINRTTTNTELSSYQFADGIQLRDYQQDAVDEWVKRCAMRSWKNNDGSWGNRKMQCQDHRFGTHIRLSEPMEGTYMCSAGQ